MKKLLTITFVLILTSGFPSAGQSKIQKLKRGLETLISGDFFKKSQISINVFDLTEKKELFRKNDDLLLRPASNMKILTSVAGLYFLGPDYTFNTEMLTAGMIEDSVLYGDLYIRGGFDPETNLSDLDSICRGLRSAGINTIQGNVFGDISLMNSPFWGKGWMWDDDPETFAAHLSPLNINKNSVCIIYKPSAIGSPVEINLYPPGNCLEFENTAVTVSGDTSGLTVTRDWINRSNKIEISGYLSPSVKEDSIRLNISRPEHLFICLFAGRLRENGIRLTGEHDLGNAPPDAVPLFVFKRKYSDVIVKLNKESDNLNAEMTLLALGLKKTSSFGNADSGRVFIDSLIALAGHDPENYLTVDGSGVSYYNLISARLVTDILKFIYINNPGLYNILYESFPVAGVDGTLEERMTEPPAYNNVRAKTGTLSGVSSLSGYLKSAKGNTIAFSVFIQNYTGKAVKARKFLDEICKILAEYK